MIAGANRLLAPAPDVEVEVIEGECLAYHPRHARAVYLNASAALIWGLCNGARSEREICRMIQDGYPDAPATLPDDVAVALAQLEGYGLLVVV
ncbi:MAG: PqqD family protein [Xanthobacteraceae bacterium]